MVEQLRKTPDDYALRKRIIMLGAEIKPTPAIPEEARRSFVKGVTIAKAAKDAGSQELTIESFNEGLKIAPWWGEAYYHLAVAQEMAGQLAEADRSLKLFLLSNPGEIETRDAKERVEAIAVKRRSAAEKAFRKMEEDLLCPTRYKAPPNDSTPLSLKREAPVNQPGQTLKSTQKGCSAG